MVDEAVKLTFSVEGSEVVPCAEDLNANDQQEIDNLRLFCRTTKCKRLRLHRPEIYGTSCDELCDAVFDETEVETLSVTKAEKDLLPLNAFLKFSQARELSFDECKGLIVSTRPKISENLKKLEIANTAIRSLDKKDVHSAEWLWSIFESPKCRLETLKLKGCHAADCKAVLTSVLPENRTLKHVDIFPNENMNVFPEFMDAMEDNDVLETLDTHFKLEVSVALELEFFAKFLTRNDTLTSISLKFFDGWTESEAFPEFRRAFLVNRKMTVHVEDDDADMDDLNVLKFSERTRVLSTWTTFAAKGAKTIENGDELKFASSRGLLEMLGRCMSTED